MIEEIYAFVEQNYNEFLRQSKVKLHWKHCEDKSAPDDLVITVILPFLEKINTNEQFLLKMYELLKTNRLFLYIIMAITNNAKFPSGPYLRNKIKHGRHKELDVNFPIENEESDHSTELLLESLLTTEKFDEMFGKYSYLYLNIIKRYSMPGETYKSIAVYYGISKSGVAQAISVIKERLKSEITK